MLPYIVRANISPLIRDKEKNKKAQSIGIAPLVFEMVPKARLELAQAFAH